MHTHYFHTYIHIYLYMFLNIYSDIFSSFGYVIQVYIKSLGYAYKRNTPSIRHKNL